MKTANDIRQTTSSTEKTDESFLLRRAEWDSYAHDDAYTYIMTDIPRGDSQAFWQSGEAIVSKELLPAVREHHATFGAALEVGCGVGRLMFPMSRHFRQVIGVDISGEMVRKGRALAAERSLSNVTFVAVPTPDELDCKSQQLSKTIDFVYSLLVFQHIDDFRVIRAYFRGICSLLTSDGIAYVQFDTRPQTFAYRIKSALPDFLLPRFWRRGIRRIRRAVPELEALFSQVGLEVVESITPGTEYHRYILRKALADR
jgi:SAM-dependent methyltransferase